MVIITAVMQMYFNCNPLSDLPESSAWFGLVINTHARSGSGFFTCSLIPPQKKKYTDFVGNDQPHSVFGIVICQNLGEILQE